MPCSGRNIKDTGEAPPTFWRSGKDSEDQGHASFEYSVMGQGNTAVTAFPLVWSDRAVKVLGQSPFSDIILLSDKRLVDSRMKFLAYGNLFPVPGTDEFISFGNNDLVVLDLGEFGFP